MQDVVAAHPRRATGEPPRRCSWPPTSTRTTSPASTASGDLRPDPVDHVWLAWTEDAEDPLGAGGAQVQARRADLAPRRARALATSVASAGDRAAARARAGDPRAARLLRRRPGLGAGRPRRRPCTRRWTTSRATRQNQPRFLSPGERCCERLAARRARLRAGPAARPKALTQRSGEPRLAGALRARGAPRRALGAEHRLRARPRRRPSSSSAEAGRARRAAPPLRPRFRLEAERQEAVPDDGFGELLRPRQAWRRIDQRLAERRRRARAAARQPHQQHQPGAGDRARRRRQGAALPRRRPGGQLALLARRTGPSRTTAARRGR